MTKYQGRRSDSSAVRGRMDRRMDGRTDRRTLPSALSPCFAVANFPHWPLIMDTQTESQVGHSGPESLFIPQ